MHMHEQVFKAPESGISLIAEEKRKLEENFDKIKDKCKRYEFSKPIDAHNFQALAIRKAMKMLGVNRMGSYQQPLVGDKIMAEKGVSMHVDKTPDHVAWRRGAYIFKNDEVVYFISSVIEEDTGPFTISRIKSWGVVTNVPVS